MYDEIIAEVWRIRDEYAAEHHHNLREMLADLKRRQRRSRRLVDRRRKPKPCAKARPVSARIHTRVRP
jgi:hypothetical protein